MPDREETLVVAKYATGAAENEQLNRSIADTWRAALSDPKKRTEIATLLGAQENELDPERPPFYAQQRGSGTFGGEILIGLAVGFAIGFTTEVGKGVGSEAGKKARQALRSLWNRHFHRNVNPPGSGDLGPEQDLEEDGSGD